MNSDAYQLIKATERLPSPKGVALEILRLTEDASTSVDALALVIESDPAIASKLLKIVNSPLSGISRKVASLSRAAILLGFRTVASLALGVSLVEDNREGRCQGFDYDQFWGESLGCGVTARHLARFVQSCSGDEAFTCGLLSQIGRLALASVYPSRYAEALRVLGENQEDLSQFEQELFGIDHNILAAEMFAEWHLPELFSQAIAHQDNPDHGELEEGSKTYIFSKLLNLSNTISKVLVAQIVDPDTLSAITNKAFHLGIRPDQIQEAFDELRTEWRDAGRIFSIQTREVPTLAEIRSRCTQRRSDLAEAG